MGESFIFECLLDDADAVRALGMAGRSQVPEARRVCNQKRRHWFSPSLRGLPPRVMLHCRCAITTVAVEVDETRITAGTSLRHVSLPHRAAASLDVAPTP